MQLTKKSSLNNSTKFESLRNPISSQHSYCCNSKPLTTRHMQQIRLLAILFKGSDARIWQVGHPLRHFYVYWSNQTGLTMLTWKRMDQSRISSLLIQDPSILLGSTITWRCWIQLTKRIDIDYLCYMWSVRRHQTNHSWLPFVFWQAKTGTAIYGQSTTWRSIYGDPNAFRQYSSPIGTLLYAAPWPRCFRIRKRTYVRGTWTKISRLTARNTFPTFVQPTRLQTSTNPILGTNLCRSGVK